MVKIHPCVLCDPGTCTYHCIFRTVFPNDDQNGQKNRDILFELLKSYQKAAIDRLLRSVEESERLDLINSLLNERRVRVTCPTGSQASVDEIEASIRRCDDAILIRTKVIENIQQKIHNLTDYQQKCDFRSEDFGEASTIARNLLGKLSDKREYAVAAFELIKEYEYEMNEIFLPTLQPIQPPRHLHNEQQQAEGAGGRPPSKKAKHQHVLPPPQEEQRVEEQQPTDGGGDLEDIALQHALPPPQEEQRVEEQQPADGGGGLEDID